MCWRLIFEQRRRGKKVDSEDAKTGRTEGRLRAASPLNMSGRLRAFPSSLFIPLICLTALFEATAGASALHKNAVVEEYDQVFPTFPYSDPDPVPAMSRYYPYFRYDGFTDKQIGRASCR